MNFIRARKGSLDISTLIESSDERGKPHFQFSSENIEFKWVFEIGWNVLFPRSRDDLVFHSAFLGTRCLKRLLPLSNDALGKRAWDEQALSLAHPTQLVKRESQKEQNEGSLRHTYVKCKNLVLEFL